MTKYELAEMLGMSYVGCREDHRGGGYEFEYAEHHIHVFSWQATTFEDAAERAAEDAFEMIRDAVKHQHPRPQSW